MWFWYICIIFKYSAFFLIYITVAADVKTKYDNAEDDPVIIWWTDILYPHLEKISKIQCSFGSCLSSVKRKYQNKNRTVAYIFYGTDFNPQNLPLPRTENHVWALLHEESPMNNYIFSHTTGIKLFNYSSTFSRESDFPLTTQFLPSLDYLIRRKPVSLEEKNKLREKGFAPVMYLQSHCHVASDRDRYVKNMMKYIKIDSYGECLHNKNLPSELQTTETYHDERLFAYIANYKFHIAFENAICDDYITEKLYRALHLGSVPIYKGSPTIKDWIPSNTSVIIADDFNSPADLAAFISKLDQSDSLYNEYLQFKELGVTNDFLKKNILERTWGVNDVNKIDFIQGYECFICDKLHLMTKSTYSVANKKHMNCPQPHLSVITGDEDRKDKWAQEDWIESYWFAFDQARAVNLMIQNKDTNTSNFMKYILNYKYHN